MYDKEIIEEETEKMFTDNPDLESKLNKLRNVLIKVRDTIKQNEEVHVSFGVFEAFNSFAEANVKEYRALETLKGVKSSFQPSFDQ